MDAKTFKSDMTYAIKKMLGQGKQLVSHNDNWNEPDYVDGRLVFGDTIEPFEALLQIKKPALSIHEEMFDRETDVATLFDTFTNPVHLYVYSMSDGTSYIMYNVNYGGMADAFGISGYNLYMYFLGEGGEKVPPADAKNEYYKVGAYIREKFLTQKEWDVPRLPTWAAFDDERA